MASLTLMVPAGRAPGRLTATQRELVERHISLATRLARRLAPGDDDCEAEAKLGLVQAARAFDPARSDFAAYARRWILGAIYDVLRETRPLGYRHTADHGPAITRLSCRCEPVVAGEAAAIDSADWVDRQLDRLPDRERAAVRLLALEGRSARSVAAELGASLAVMAETYHRAIARLGHHLEPRPGDRREERAAGGVSRRF